jgi:cytochrome o ubiquinol oxidase operon protein cyoD
MHDSSAGEMPDVRSYFTGLALALLLTVIPFALVYFKPLPSGMTLALIAVLAIIQILVHLRCFLHLDLTSTPRENLLAFCFAGVLIFIMVGGSLWIMFDLHHRMAPHSEQHPTRH